MKVLYIGNYKDGTGWGNAALGNILSMRAANIEVVARAITYRVDDLGSSSPIEVIDAENMSRSGCDIVVQHVLPRYYSYNGDYKKNVGYLDLESYNIRPTGWHRYCNMMDEMWVPSEDTKRLLEDSGVNVPIKIVPHAIDIKEIENHKRTSEIPALQGLFTFGFIGEFIERKNVKALVQAFHMEFDPREPVNLLIKTSGKDMQFIEGYLRGVRNGLRIRNNYRKEVVVTGMLNKNEYFTLMNQIDCFVMPSRGEAFCIPAVEAMALGKNSIYTASTGMDHLLGWGVASHKVPCFGALESMTGLDTAMSTWREIDVLELCKTMRSAYNTLSQPSDLAARKTAAISEAQKFGYTEVGQTIRRILNDNA